ncbi:NUDIX domain-containing protein [Catenulispora sp. NL8]|uniref:NUDIX domain-containing protein n=1 Tax=Catenulispora pinistramenti TaxID=2705254 RepID=A0ABS5L5C8_9ACTN|nr:NUDIX domain-containing protein [Catenulispora pinistramenti]MBS2553450.1 NUDIX domain-containing protein [Catenulispora pinistramenti]
MGTAADVEAKLRSRLANGTHVPGQQLPSERTIGRLDTSRNTVRLAPTRLIADGSIRPEHGRRYFVCEPRRADPPVQQWKVKSAGLVLEGPLFDVEQRQLSSSAGQQKHSYIARSPASVSTAVLDVDDRLLMVWRQHEAPGTGSWDLPCGPVEEGEDLVAAAARTTKTLTGVSPARLQHVIGFQPFADLADARQELFVGWSDLATPISTRSRGEYTAEWIGLAELPALIAEGSSRHP